MTAEERLGVTTIRATMQKSLSVSAWHLLVLGSSFAPTVCERSDTAQVPRRVPDRCRPAGFDWKASVVSGASVAENSPRSNRYHLPGKTVISIGTGFST